LTTTFCCDNITTKGGEIVNVTRIWLRDIRVKMKLSQREAAEKMGISQQYYAMIEVGERQKKNRYSDFV